MATNPQAYNQILGTHGKMYWNGEEIFEVIAFKLDMKREYDEQMINGSLVKDAKLKSIAYEGTVKMKMVYSRNTSKFLDSVKSGKDIRGEFFCALADPDAKGAERVACRNVWFKDTFPLFEFEQGKNMEREYSFGCTDVQFYDYIN